MSVGLTMEAANKFASIVMVTTDVHAIRDTLWQVTTSTALVSIDSANNL